MTRKSKTTPLTGKLNRDVFFQTSPDLPRIIEIDLAKLRPNPDQPRKVFDEATLEDLANSIAQHGLIQPIAVAHDLDHENGFIVVAGERRYRACMRLERKTIPAIVTRGNPDEIALIENIQRQNLNPVEEAEALAKMMERHGYTQEEVGKVIGKAQNTVSEILQLNILPGEIKNEYRTSDNAAISKSLLIELSRIDNQEEQLSLWCEIKQGRLTVKAIRARKQRRSSQASPSPTSKVLVTGKRFLKSLERLDTINHEEYLALMEISRAINERVDKLSKYEE